jgi:hypothetical protein
LVCGSEEFVTKHHVRPKRAGGQNGRNLAPLCEQHHALVERYYWWRLSFGNPVAANCIKQIAAAMLDGRIPHKNRQRARERQQLALRMMEEDVDWKGLFRDAVKWTKSVEIVRPIRLAKALTEKPWWRKRRTP